MGFWKEFFGGANPINATGSLVEKTGDALNKLFTSDDERLTHQQLIERLRQRPQEFAHELNVLNAKGNWFNSGWRPALGWVGAISLFLFYVPQYVMAAYVWVRAVNEYLEAMAADQAIDLPAYPVNADGIMELVGLLLGAAVIRQVDKRMGTAKN